jgi:putative membrane protein
VLEQAPVMGGLALAGALYGRGAARLGQRTGRRHGGRVLAFALGLAAVALVLVTPLDSLGEERLWAHMVQHMVLSVVAAPLLVLANPLPAMLWGLPDRARRAAAPWWRRVARSHAQVRGWVAWSVVALVVHTAAMWAWHAPAAYEAAVRSHWLHVLQHSSFLGSALFFWWAVLGSRRRALYGAGVLVIFLAALQGTALGAYMTLSERIWYPVYSHAGGNLTPIEDQQVAGVIMWGPSGVAYLLAAMLLFAAWIGGGSSRLDLSGRQTDAALASIR